MALARTDNGGRSTLFEKDWRREDADKVQRTERFTFYQAEIVEINYEA